jgi:hypothetical protein
MTQGKYKHHLHLNLQEPFGQGKDLLEWFPELAVYEEFTPFKGKELNRFILYVFYAYDPGSGFVDKIRDLSKRKEEAAREAGLSLKDERVQQVIAMQDAEVNAMITRFLRSFVQNHEFELWLSGCEMIWQLLEEIRTPINKQDLKDDAAQRANKTRMDNFAEMPKLIKQVKDLEEVIFGKDKNLRESAVEAAAKINMGAVERFLSFQKE